MPVNASALHQTGVLPLSEVPHGKLSDAARACVCLLTLRLVPAHRRWAWCLSKSLWSCPPPATLGALAGSQKQHMPALPLAATSRQPSRAMHACLTRLIGQAAHFWPSGGLRSRMSTCASGALQMGRLKQSCRQKKLPMYADLNPAPVQTARSKLRRHSAVKYRPRTMRHEPSSSQHSLGGSASRAAGSTYAACRSPHSPAGWEHSPGPAQIVDT